MSEGISTAIDKLSKEVSAINRTLLAIWSLIHNDDKGMLPIGMDDEYISIDECARRLDVSEQTIRNWITQGTKGPAGWIQGVHYIVLPTGNLTKGRGSRRQTIRIPWKTLVQDLVLHRQNRKLELKEIQHVLAPREFNESKDKYF